MADKMANGFDHLITLLTTTIYTPIFGKIANTRGT